MKSIQDHLPFIQGLLPIDLNNSPEFLETFMMDAKCWTTTTSLKYLFLPRDFQLITTTCDVPIPFETNALKVLTLEHTQRPWLLLASQATLTRIWNVYVLYDRGARMNYSLCSAPNWQVLRGLISDSQADTLIIFRYGGARKFDWFAPFEFPLTLWVTKENIEINLVVEAKR